MSNNNKTDIFIIIGFSILILSILVSATQPQWTGNDVNYTASEDTFYYHNLSSNIIGFDNDVRFTIDANAGTYVQWTNSSGTYNVTASSISGWISIINSSTGKLLINATTNNQTGFFKIPIIAYNTTDQSASEVLFGFIVNAANDPPYFYTQPSYFINLPIQGNKESNITLSGSDEEKQYPLRYSLTFLNCSHASWSTKTDCNLTYNNISNSSDIVIASNTTSILEFSNLTNEDTGSYNLTICAHDDVNSVTPPLYRNSDYDINQTYCRNTTLILLSSLTVDASNCSGATKEGETFNCTINITTQGAEDNIDYLSYAVFLNSSYSAANNSWFYPSGVNTSSSFFYSLPISITPTKEDVGNWTINFSVFDTNTLNAKTANIELFVNYSESNDSLKKIPNITIYENKNITITGYDNDLLIQDKSIKNEILNFTSNTSWVIPNMFLSTSGNSTTSLVTINYSYAINNSLLGNQSVVINVTDVSGNIDSKVFIINISIDNPPKWNTSSPVILNLTEDKNFFYNLTKNITDADGDNISFYYKNTSGVFSPLSTFSPQGIINFTPTDYDVGFHNVSIIASDNKLNRSMTFIFNISNTEDLPSIYSFSGPNITSISNGSIIYLAEKKDNTFNLTINDDDFLVPQKNYYYESLSVNITFVKNTANSKLFNFSFIGFIDTAYPSRAFYSATFNPNISQVGNWTALLNVTDANGSSVTRAFIIDIEESAVPPVLQLIKNQSTTIYDSLNISINATDDRDDYNNVSLVYSISKLNSSAPNLKILGNRILGNMSSNDSGIWGYNVTVTDSKNLTDSQIFYIYVYGHVTLEYPAQNTVFNATERFLRTIGFIISQKIESNLVYEFWIGNMTCSFHNASNCSYGILKVRKSDVYIGEGSSIIWEFRPNFNDETYGNTKNLTLRIYPDNTTNLTLKQRESIATNFTFKLNISHTNAPMRAISNISLLTSDYNHFIDVNLNGYFSDEDVDDPYYLQNVTFVKVPSTGDIFITHTSGWNIQIGTTNKTAHEEFISILGSDGNTSAQIDNIPIKFTAPVVTPKPTPTPSSGGGSPPPELKFYSLRIITPGDITISNNNYIKIPFSLKNYGAVDLRGINLSNTVLYNNDFSEGIKIDMDASYIKLLKAGEERNYTMKIIANTSKSGQYKIRLFAKISHPELTDWADFFINLKKTNDTQAEKTLIFTKKIIADNPECLELTEDLRRAKDAFNAGNISESIKMAQKVTAACEDSITANDQIRYSAKGFIEKNIYYILVLVLIMFASGFAVYIYKRARFNKSEEDKYFR